MEIETAEITLKFDEKLEFLGLYEGDEDPEEKKTQDKQPSKDDKEESKSNDPVKDIKEWHVPCSAAGCNICDNKGPEKKTEDRKSKSKTTTPEILGWKRFTKEANVPYFEGGFVLKEKMKPVTLKIRAPVDTLSWRRSRDVAVVDSGANSNKGDDPEYTIPIYQGYLPVSAFADSIDATKMFIYTGYKDNKRATQGQYMLVEDLKKRVEKGCEEVYNADLKKLQKGERPFDLWNAEGALIKAENNFLRSTFQLDPGSDEWLVALFRLYCDIANSAQRTPSEPWTVKARFWSTGIAKDEKEIVPKDFTVLFDSNLITEAQLQGCIALVGSALGKKKAHLKTPFILPAGCSLEGKSTWPEFKKKRQELEKTMVAIGRHPRLVYEIWATESSLCQGFWARSCKLRKGVNTKLLEKPQQTETNTTISTKSMSAARNYPRTLQADVMGISANELAKLVWCNSEENCDSDGHQCSFSGQAEWLHRSAFSYGGLVKGGGPKSSQVPGNLVLGTKETNTKMIREEAFVKRFVRKTGKDVKLTTSLDAEENRNPEVGTRLNYFVTLPMPTQFAKIEDKAKATAAHEQPYQSFYCLMERKVPTLFEVLLDVEVDKIVYRWGTIEKWVY